MWTAFKASASGSLPSQVDKIKMSDIEAEWEDAGCEKTVFACSDNLWLTFVLWPPGVLFISDLASCLPAVIYHNISVTPSTTTFFLRNTRHDCKLWYDLISFYLSVSKIRTGGQLFPTQKKKLTKLKSRSMCRLFFFLPPLKSECRDDLGTWCARNSLTAEVVSCKSVLWFLWMWWYRGKNCVYCE